MEYRAVDAHLLKLAGWFSSNNWPYARCPVCGDGFCQPEDQSVRTVETKASQRRRESGRHDPSEASGYFIGHLRCTKPACREIVAVSGQFIFDYDWIDDKDEAAWDEMFRLRFTQPALSILDLPARTPVEVKNRVSEAAAIIWSDPNAAANRLRLAIDDLLTAHRIPRKEYIQRKGAAKRTLRDRSTDSRIRLFRDKKSEVAEALMAVKWIGNQGSHEDSLTTRDVLLGADLLNHALELLYDDTTTTLKKQISSVNKGKGIRKSKNS